ncbi:MAG: B12 binding domain protein [candidate division BRC1 bacterium ADurb.BinA364]|nr:MAG: B12 binding domain protein [candidate division BRC1 bacterium ADurb.BinA364]
MKFLFITLYDHIATGCRELMGFLTMRGHQCTLVHFKSHAGKHQTPRGQELEPSEVPGMEYGSLRRILPLGDSYHPFPKLVTQREIDLLCDIIAEERPALIGFTLLSSFIHVAKKVSPAIKERFPDIPLAWGGIHAMFMPEESLRYADIACVGEGERALEEFAADPSRTDIKNLWFKKDGQIIRNERRPLEQDLDSLHFHCIGHTREVLIEDGEARELTMQSDPDFFRYNYYVSTQRGCAFKCSYCTHGVMRDWRVGGGAYLRRHSPEWMLRQLEKDNARLKLDFLHFMDDVFLLDPKWVREFLDGYKKRIGVPFWCYIYPVHNVHEMLEWGRDAGLVCVNIGIQSGSEFIKQKIFDRHYTNEAMKAMCWRCRELGIQMHYDILCNNPYEDECHLRETVEFLLELPKADIIHTFPLCDFPGLRINTLNYPRYDLPGELRLFYSLMYQLTRHPDVSDQVIRELCGNEHYKRNPEELGRLIHILMKPILYEEGSKENSHAGLMSATPRPPAAPSLAGRARRKLGQIAREAVRAARSIGSRGGNGSA